MSYLPVCSCYWPKLILSSQRFLFPFSCMFLSAVLNSLSHLVPRSLPRLGFRLVSCADYDLSVFIACVVLIVSIPVLPTDIQMKENVQAHQGQVTFLRVSAACVESQDNIASRDHLLSCGTDCTVKIWQLTHPENNRVSIQHVALVKMLQCPRELAMAGNTLCMAMADNNVIMCRSIFIFLLKFLPIAMPGLQFQFKVFCQIKFTRKCSTK